MRHANYRIVRESDEEVVIEDLGPWNGHPTVTNDAEWVVEQLAGYLRGRRLRYFDSFGDLDTLVVRDGKFAGFIHEVT
jgi:hypothetical protein